MKRPSKRQIQQEDEGTEGREGLEAPVVAPTFRPSKDNRGQRR
ncbi:unnamed protein product [Brassica oleracea var. botrytis]